LCPALIASDGSEDIAKKLRISTGEGGFFMEKHPKVEPVDLSKGGCYACGTALGPKDIHETVAKSLGVAARINNFIGKGEIEIEPKYVEIDEELCNKCEKCIEICPNVLYKEEGTIKVDPISCNGCGFCIPECDKKAIDFIVGTDKELMAQIEGILSHDEEVVLCFSDSAISYTAIDRISSSRLQYPSNIRVISTPVGRIRLDHISHAFKLGAKGIIMLYSHDITEEQERILRDRVEDFKRALTGLKINPLCIDMYKIYPSQYLKLVEIFKTFNELVQ